MENEYKYRRAPNKGPILLSSLGVALLLAYVLLADADHLMWMVWVFGALTMSWMLMPKRIFGIKVDDEYLVLAAWRNPRYVRLKEISHLRASNISDETRIAIVFNNGHEEGIFEADLPDDDTLIAVMSERGIPVRGLY